MKRFLIYDDYNSNIPKEQGIIGCVTPTFSRHLRAGKKIIEVFDDKQERDKAIGWMCEPNNINQG